MSAQVMGWVVVGSLGGFVVGSAGGSVLGLCVGVNRSLRCEIHQWLCVGSVGGSVVRAGGSVLGSVDSFVVGSIGGVSG